jgi:RNA-binding protein
MILELTSIQRRALRARAHGLHPVVMIGNAGLSTAVLNEINKNLARHELIKIRVFSDEHAVRAQWLGEVCATLHAAPVQHIGKILVVYRPLPALPEDDVKARRHKAAPKRKPPRRIKRSFQR